MYSPKNVTINYHQYDQNCSVGNYYANNMSAGNSDFGQEQLENSINETEELLHSKASYSNAASY